MLRKALCNLSLSAYQLHWEVHCVRNTNLTAKNLIQNSSLLRILHDCLWINFCLLVLTTYCSVAFEFSSSLQLRFTRNNFNVLLSFNNRDNLSKWSNFKKKIKASTCWYEILFQEEKTKESFHYRQQHDNPFSIIFFAVGDWFQALNPLTNFVSFTSRHLQVDEWRKLTCVCNETHGHLVKEK